MLNCGDNLIFDLKLNNSLYNLVCGNNQLTSLKSCDFRVQLEENISEIPKFEHMSFRTLFLKCRPLSEVKYLGTPESVIKFIKNFLTEYASNECVAFASIYLEL